MEFVGIKGSPKAREKIRALARSGGIKVSDVF
jgi:hypothetical protein